MKFIILIKYFHPALRIGLEDLRNAWLFEENKNPVLLRTCMHQGRLYYRLPVSGKRISYQVLKKGLIRKNLTIRLPLELLPF